MNAGPPSHRSADGAHLPWESVLAAGSLAYAASPVPMWVYDPGSLRILSVNDAAVASYGWTREQFLDLRITDLRPPEDAPALFAALEDTQGPAAPPSGDRPATWGVWRHCTQDGRTLHVEIRFQSVTFAGARARWVTAHPVGPGGPSDAALAASEERYRLLAENSADVIWLRDLDLRLLYVSPSVERLRGYTVEEVLGHALEDSYAAGSVADAQRMLTELQAMAARPPSGDASVSAELEVRRRDGSTFWCEQNARVLRGPDGSARGLVGIGRDITPRVVIERMLREKTRQLETVTESMTAYLTTGRFQAAAERLVRGAMEQTGSALGLLGACGPGAVVRVLAYGGMDLAAVTDPAFREGAVRDYLARGWVEFRNPDTFFGRIVRTGQALVANDPACDPRAGGLPPGHPKVHAFLGVPILRGTEVLGLVGVANRPGGYGADEQGVIEVLARAGGVLLDGYRRHETETAHQTQLGHAQKMEALGQFAGGIAHDFNNVLTAVLGNGELALRQLPPGSPARAHLTQMISDARRSAALTRQILAFSRRQVVQPQIVDVNDVLHHLGHMLRRVIGEQVELDFDLRATPANVFVDPVQLEQVVLNLAVNARDALPDGGRLTIETDCIHVEAGAWGAGAPERPGAYVVVAVSDTGCGMSAEVRERVFEPFFTTKECGTGLGLATVYGIARQAAGHVALASDLGRGTTFRVHFPLAIGELSSRATPEPTLLPHGTETVLVAEDEPAVRELAEIALTEAGYRVLVAEDGLSAEAAAASHDGAIDLLVTDLVMPRLNGAALAERLAQRFPALRVLIMSGYASDTVLNGRGLPAGAAFLEKPFTLEQFIGKVRDLLDDRG